MKKLILIGVVGALVSNSALAHHNKPHKRPFDGFRIGAGYSNVGVDFNSVEDDVDGVKGEIGYDFDNIFGVSASYAQTSGKFKGEGFSTDLDNVMIRLGADIGYAFQIKRVFIKPYIKTGIQSFESETSDDYAEEVISEIGVYYGAGVRMHYKHFYTDISFDQSKAALDSEYGGEDVDVTQTTITIGYKF